MKLETTRSNEQKIIIGEYNKVALKVDYFWDAHGDLINWNEHVDEPTYLPWADIKIRKYSFVENLCGKEFYFVTDQLIVNDRVIAGDLLEYNLEKDESGFETLVCKLAVGWG